MSKLMVQITTADDHLERASLGFLVANVALASKQEVVVLLTIEGVRLAVKGHVEGKQATGFEPLPALMQKYVEAGGRIWVCGACAKPREITQEQVVAGAQVIGAATAVEYLVTGGTAIVA